MQGNDLLRRPPDQGRTATPGQRGRQIVLVGCPRSGTSPFAKLLRSAGLRTVEDTRSTRKYPSGYYEHMPLLMFHKAMERLPRGADYSITTEPFLKSSYLDDEFIRGLFLEACHPILQGSVDFIKLPQLALSVDFLFEQFGQIHVIALWRNPACTFRSLVTNEFPREMRPASGVKAVLLWNLYAYHIIRAAKERPADVTVVNIDDVIDKDRSIAPLLRKLGHNVSDLLPSQHVDGSVWTRRVAWRWWIYFHAMRVCCSVLGRFLPADTARLASVKQWQSRLWEATS